jgi:flagellar L-ring protein precursor FlgH
VIAARVLLAVAALAIGGCATDLADVNRQPALTPVGSGLAAASAPVDVAAYPVDDFKTDPGWEGSSADLFRDRRAARVGDTVRVKIEIDDRASLDSTSDRSRRARVEGSLDFSGLFNGVPSNGNGEVTLDSRSNYTGEGATERAETIELLVAAVVTDVLANGNLVVRGTQEVRVNYEVRELEIGGIVDPLDITGNNTVDYDRLAEARISYGGRGRIDEVQQPRWGQQVYDLIAPF